jgi:hypothetical protein
LTTGGRPPIRGGKRAIKLSLDQTSQDVISRLHEKGISASEFVDGLLSQVAKASAVESETAFQRYSELSSIVTESKHDLERYETIHGGSYLPTIGGGKRRVKLSSIRRVASPSEPKVTIGVGDPIAFEFEVESGTHPASVRPILDNIPLQGLKWDEKRHGKTRRVELGRPTKDMVGQHILRGLITFADGSVRISGAAIITVKDNVDR